MRMAVLFVTTILSIIPLNDGFAQTDNISANGMLPGCRRFLAEQMLSKGYVESFQEGECLGLIRGLSIADPRVCTPSGVTFGQLVRVAVAYLDARPARHHEAFADLALESLRQAFPCKR